MASASSTLPSSSEPRSTAAVSSWGAHCRPAPRGLTRSQYSAIARAAVIIAGDDVIDNHPASSLCRPRPTTGMPSFFAVENGEVFLVDVDHEDQVRKAFHLADAAQRGLAASAGRAPCRGALSWFRPSEAPGAKLSSICLRRVIELRERSSSSSAAAKPAVVHVILCAALGGIPDGLLRLALGADEEDATPLATVSRRTCSAWSRSSTVLRPGDDVDAVAVTVDIRCNPRGPALGLVAEVNARFEKLRGKSQGEPSTWVLSGLRPRRRIGVAPNRWTLRGVSPEGPLPPVK